MIPDLVCQSTSVALDMLPYILVIATVIEAVLLLGGAYIIRRKRNA